MTKHELVSWIPDSVYLKLRYRKAHGRSLNLKNPERFTEKIQWLKIYGCKPEYAQMVDKSTAKEYVVNRLGKTLDGGVDRYIIPTLGVWDSFDDIDFNSLPNRFVLKVTHDSGGIVICRDKSHLDLKKAKEKIEKSLVSKFYLVFRERVYEAVKPRIIAEEYLENDSKDGLHDYKVWCFNGQPKYIQYISGRIGNDTYEGFYDLNWNLQKFTYLNPLTHTPIDKPGCLDELIELAKILSENIPFARIDFYILEDGSIRFGEITFYPNAGMAKWHPDETDYTLGKMINLSNDSRG